jgi:hypothetical protein
MKDRLQAFVQAFRRTISAMPQERRPELEGVPEGWSTTYAAPDFEPPDEAFGPAPRRPALQIRLVPNETLLPGPLGEHLGDLMQRLIDEGADYGVAVEIDTSDRTRPDEMRGGASPVEAIELVVFGLAARQAVRLTDRLFDAIVDWVLAHRRHDVVEPVMVNLYDAEGNLIKKVEVPQDGGQPREREIRER